MPLTPAVTIHLAAALSALVLGPLVLWSRRRGQPSPRLHRGLGYAWVTLMVLAALSALFIRSTHLPNVGGFTPIHLLVPATLASLVVAFHALAIGNVARHRRVMRGLYTGGCLVAGAFTLAPGRTLGQLAWGALGLL